MVSTEITSIIKKLKDLEIDYYSRLLSQKSEDKALTQDDIDNIDIMMEWMLKYLEGLRE